MDTHDAAILKRRQECGQKVEKEMLDFLIQYTPCRSLSVGDVQTIASHARHAAFNAWELEK